MNRKGLGETLDQLSGGYTVMTLAVLSSRDLYRGRCVSRRVLHPVDVEHLGRIRATNSLHYVCHNQDMQMQVLGVGVDRIRLLLAGGRMLSCITQALEFNNYTSDGKRTFSYHHLG